jgi:hypothetical protein
VYLANKDNSKLILLDMLTGIGFSHTVSTIPVYGLGNQEPEFFSMGNSLVTGTLELTFKHNSYLQKAIDYIVGNSELSVKIDRIAKAVRTDPKKVSNEDMAFYNKYYASMNRKRREGASLSEYPDLTNLVIRYNNSNTFKSSSDMYTTIVGVRFNTLTQGVSSQAENLVTDQIRFIAKNINTKPVPF